MIKIYQNKLFWCYFSYTILALQSAMGQTRLDNYIREGIESNQSIRQQNFMLEKNMYALSEAKSMFLPNVAFSSTYTKAAGGRTIAIPVGDMLNNV